MDEYQKTQISILNDKIQDYQDNRASLGSLVSTVEGVLSIVKDEAFKNDVFPHLVALEEVNARSKEQAFDFIAHGKPVVEKALRSIREYCTNLG